jgi:hypothetical protein
LEHAIEVNPGGVNGPAQIAVLDKAGAQWRPRILGKEEFGEHRQNVNGAYEALRDYRNKQKSDAVEGPLIPQLGPAKGQKPSSSD